MAIPRLSSGGGSPPNIRPPAGSPLRRRLNVSMPVTALGDLQADFRASDAVKLDYDQSQWLKRFLSVWPEGSSAHTSYFTRLNGNVGYSVVEAVRDFRRWRTLK